MKQFDEHLQFDHGLPFDLSLQTAISMFVQIFRLTVNSRYLVVQETL